MNCLVYKQLMELYIKKKKKKKKQQPIQNWAE